MSTPPRIAVAGAGVAGLCAAEILQARGCDVTLFDPLLTDEGSGAPNASALAGGMLAPYAEIEHMPPEWIAAGLAGITFWEAFSQEHQIGFVKKGSFLVAHEGDRYLLRRFEAHLPPETRSYRPVVDIEPALAGLCSSGLFLPEEAHLVPLNALEALRESIRKGGGRLETCAVTPEALACDYDYVLDCRGMGASGDVKDLRGVKGEIVIVRNSEFSLERPVRLMHPRYPLYIVPRPDHVFMIGATVIESGEAAAEGSGAGTVSVRSALELLSALYSLHTSFGEARILQILSGVRPAYSDNLPHIRIEDRIVRCNGLFRHGFLLSPVMGQCVADYMTGVENRFSALFMQTGNKKERAAL
ncbi:MAG: FAD-dependent oxidoreductase [Alphaproteobacteria bacterium]|nr:FAD-dependent oxidoreductase [Alphaproteobacteria bacterium]